MTNGAKILVVLLAISSFVRGQDVAESELTAKQQAAKKRLDYMVASASGFVGTRKSDGAELKATDEPLLRFTNPHHGCREGLFVAWVDPNNRPVAVGQVFLYAGSENRWYIETQSLSDGAMDFSSPDNSAWSPREAGVEWKKFESKTSKPAKSKGLRLGQMRKLARRFGGDDDLGGTNDVLRMMSNPMIRYEDLEKGVLDGALFTYVQGTDPELLVQIEARKNVGGEYEFWWALAPMTSAKLEAYLDGNHVWTKPKISSNLSTDVFFFRPLKGGVPYPLDG